MKKIRNVKKIIENDLEELHNATREKVWGYIAGALGLVAGLAWNEAIKGLIDNYLPIQRDSAWAKVWYALVVTAFVVFVMMKLERYFKKEEDPGKKEMK